MQKISLSSIHRDPLKGFGAQAPHEAKLEVGRGLAFGWAWAITNAERVLAEQGAWMPCQAFVRRTKNTHLPLFDVQFDERSLKSTLLHRDRRSLRVDLNSSASTESTNQVFAQWLPAQLPQAPMQPQLAAASRGAGDSDHSDATGQLARPRRAAGLESTCQLPRRCMWRMPSKARLGRDVAPV